MYFPCALRPVVPDLSGPEGASIYAPRMSRGRHSRPRARGGGLATLLALALAGGAVAIGLTSPSTTTLRLCVIGGAAVGAIGLLLLARLQRVSSRAQARTEDRLRTLELRSRDESADLHRRVIEAVTREGELRSAVDMLSSEIARLRSALDGLVAPVGAAVATIAERAVQPAPTYDLPLVQRAFAEEVEPERVLESPLVVAVPVEPAAPLAPPAVAPAAAAASAPAPADVRSWVVRELDVSDESEPVAALTMRILDLRTPLRVDEDDPEPASAGWTSFARPA
jgi:hypothetical protein